MVNKHISTFQLSKDLQELGVKRPIEIASFVYDSFTGELFIVLNIIDNDYMVTSLDYKVTTTQNRDKFCKAYLSSELGEILPIDYTLPIKFDDGWAYANEEGEILLIEGVYYETEVQARIRYLLHFLYTGVIKPEEL